MKFVDLFAGIGGFRLGLEQAGHECLAFCEIDKFARKSYKAIHDTEGEEEFHDITAVTDESVRGIGSVDIISGGFPCQAFSIAGKRRGFEDTRGTLFFEIARFASILRPRYLFLENVKGLLNHEGGATFETILRALDELGYDVEWQVLNSEDYLPQNRERVFIIGHLRGERTGKVFPIRSESKSTNKKQSEINIVGNTQSDESNSLGHRDNVYSTDGLIGALIATDYKGPKQILINENTKLGYAEAKVGDSVNLSHPNSKTRRGRVGKGVANTLLAGDGQGVVVWDMYNKRKRTDGNVGTLTANGNTSFTHSGTFGIEEGMRIRKLTPLECWRLQGFPDWAFDRAEKVNSNSQLYKQAGNSVTVNVIYEIARRFKE